MKSCVKQELPVLILRLQIFFLGISNDELEKNVAEQLTDRQCWKQSLWFESRVHSFGTSLSIESNHFA